MLLKFEKFFLWKATTHQICLLQGSFFFGWPCNNNYNVKVQIGHNNVPQYNSIIVIHGVIWFSELFEVLTVNPCVANQTKIPTEKKHFFPVGLFVSCKLHIGQLFWKFEKSTRHRVNPYINYKVTYLQLLIPTADVLKVSKEKTAKFIPNAVGIFTEDEKHVFSSLLSRDSTYKLMVQVWKAATDHALELKASVSKEEFNQTLWRSC